MRVCVVGITLFLAVAVAGCDDNPVEPDRDGLPQLSKQQERVVAKGNEFGLRLFSSLSEWEREESPGEDKNVVISPLSVSMALGMTLNGAVGSTRDGMEEALDLSGLTSPEINEAFRDLIELLEEIDPGVVMEIANSIWSRQGFPVEQSFVDVNRTYFDAEIAELNFDDPGAVDTINGWVSEKTHRRIESIIDRISPMTVMFLINAVYFKGTWQFEFDEALTEYDEFQGPNGTTQPVKMMQQEASLAFYENAEVQIVDLPYGDSLYSMSILLPKAGKTVDQVVEALSIEDWSLWMSNLHTVPLRLFLPRFTTTYDALLNDVLIAMGMTDAFDPAVADFSAINPNARALGMHISKVIHKTFVEVNEEGTEAAAVTAVVVELTSIGGGKRVFRVDRPFLFFIREHYTGTILFAGKMVDLS